jgi:poly(3-hydroxybutyrate) depolymerase
MLFRFVNGAVKALFNFQIMEFLTNLNFKSISAIRSLQFLIVAITALITFSCKKTQAHDPFVGGDTTTNNNPDTVVVIEDTTIPKVDAGSLSRVVYPTSTSAILSGSGSDSIGAVTFNWTQIGGNSPATITQPASAVTTVSNLKPGLYTFVLTVTNKGNISRADTTQISVLEKLTWTVEGTTREALVHPSTGGSGAAPVIIAFHGHGGTDTGYAEKVFELFWPEAIVVYPQGLDTKTSVDSNCREPGWQDTVGEINCKNGIEDQDLKFFDAMLPTFKEKYNANLSLVFVHGWSNGADFIYNVLWRARRDEIAALAPAGGNMDTTLGKQPIPVIAISGTLDDKIPFTEQQRDVQNVRILNQCSPDGTKWATGPNGLLATRYESPVKAPVVFLKYAGDHKYPYTVPPLIIKFFKEIAGVE